MVIFLLSFFLDSRGGSVMIFGNFSVSFSLLLGSRDPRGPSRDSVREHGRISDEPVSSLPQFCVKPFEAFFFVFFGAIEMTSANRKVGPGGAESQPKAPQGLPKAVPNGAVCAPRGLVFLVSANPCFSTTLSWFSDIYLVHRVPGTTENASQNECGH